jgi:hypothetical protein
MKLFFLLFSILASITVIASGKDVGLPSRDPSVVLPLLRSISREPDIDAIEKILGHYDKDEGSGVFLLIYRLDDGSTICIDGTSLKRLASITLLKEGHKIEIIYEKGKMPNQSLERTPLGWPVCMGLPCMVSLSSGR